MPRSDTRRLLDLLVIGGLIALIVYVLVSALIPKQRGRPYVLRVRGDLRSLATAVEAYFVDHHRYPAWAMGDTGPGGTQTYNHFIAGVSSRKPGEAADLPNFLMNADRPDAAFQTLTTPMSYITRFPIDEFCPIKDATFIYWSINPGETDPSGKIVGSETAFGWIMVSAGPDKDYDIPDDYDVYDPRIPQPSMRLLTGVGGRGSAFTYDPTNGTLSSGDIWRVKQ